MTAEALSNPWVQSLWRSRFAPSSQLAAHHHNEPTLCLVLGGKYLERICGRETEHGSGDLLYCPAGETHSQTISAHGAVKILLRPTHGAVDYLGEHIALARAPALRSPRIAAIGAGLAAELDAPDGFSSLVVEGLVAEMLGLLARSAATAREAAGRQLRAAREFVIEHACTGITIAELARAVGGDPVRLAEGFRRSFGKSIGHYAREVRLVRALESLTGTRTPIVQIAAECGFHDQAHFTRAFRAAYGITPARYRRGLH